MKDDLKRLINEFLQETKEARTMKVDLQLTNKMAKKTEWVTSEPTFMDFISWLNSK